MVNLKTLVLSEEWRRHEAPHVFPTKSSFEWFGRQHRQRLVNAGALLPRSGRAGSLVNPERMSAEVVAILAEQAQERGAVYCPANAPPPAATGTGGATMGEVETAIPKTERPPGTATEFPTTHPPGGTCAPGASATTRSRAAMLRRSAHCAGVVAQPRCEP